MPTCKVQDAGGSLYRGHRGGRDKQISSGRQSSLFAEIQSNEKVCLKSVKEDSS